MKNIQLIISLLAIALALGCQSAAKKTARQPDGDTAGSNRDYNFGEKNSFVLEMRAQLIKLNKDVDDLSVKIDEADGAWQGDAKLRLDMLREKVKQLDKQLDDDSQATLPTWNSMKTDTEANFAELKAGIEELNQTTNKKNTP
jgi:hypothetical protein